MDATDTESSPWTVVSSDDKRAAHLNCLSHMLQQIPYEPLGQSIVTLPKRNKNEAYDDKEPMKARRYVEPLF
jgi:hypothetical protein